MHRFCPKCGYDYRSEGKIYHAFLSGLMFWPRFLKYSVKYAYKYIKM